MKKYLIAFLLMPLLLQAQDINIPHVKFDQGSILFNIPSQSSFAPALPAIKPGFVHILQTPGFQSKSTSDISDDLASGILDLLSQSMNQKQKFEFLEKYACLILLYYSRVSELDTAFYYKAVVLQADSDQIIKTNAALVVKMVEMYLGKGRESKDQKIQ